MVSLSLHNTWFLREDAPLPLRHIPGNKTHTHPFHGPFPGLPGWAGTRKVKPIWILLKQETVSGSGISWAICKSAPRSRQITTPAPTTQFFTDRMPSCRPTNSVKALKAPVTVTSYAMHTIKITPNLLFEYQCTSGKFIRLPNQIEKIDSVARIESKHFLPELECSNGWPFAYGHIISIRNKPLRSAVQLSFQPHARREISTSQSVVILWGWKSTACRYGSFHLWINMWVAGKTVWFIVNTCHTWVPL